jgi:type IV pilus assembly protein PilB
MKEVRMQTIDLTTQSIDLEAAELLGPFYCGKYNVLPIKIEAGRIYLAMSSEDMRVITDIGDLTGYFVEPLLTSEQDIRFYINDIFGQKQRSNIADQHVKAAATVQNHAGLDEEQIKAAPAVRFLDSLIEAGVLNRASDIHIEPYDNMLRARYRVDGRLKTFSQADISILPNIISRLKVMSGLDISEKRLPQDGHFNLTVGGEEIGFRVSTLPTFYGEKAAIRLLFDSPARIKKDALGFFEEDLPQLNRMFNQSYGAVIMTGPTGSGKSTTLNSFLEEINTEEVNIVTVEDPVENPLFGVNHIQVEPAIGLTFASILRNILRQDPDVIVIGEMRDAETARIAIQAAITGHLVLSTLHTNDAAGVVERLADMGVEAYLSAAALNGILSQRLVRRLCPNCKLLGDIEKEEADILRLPYDTKVYQGLGCPRCGMTGYKGRLAVYEYVYMNEELRRQMSTDPHLFAASLRKRPGLRENALRNMELGNTDAKEIIRVLSRDI